MLYIAYLIILDGQSVKKPIKKRQSMKFVQSTHTFTHTFQPHDVAHGL